MGLSAHAVPLLIEKGALTPQNTSTIRVVDPRENQDWDDQISRLKEACFFHGAAWPRVIHESYGHSPRYYMGKTSGAQPEVVPLVEINSALTGRRGVSLAFADFCAPLTVSRESYLELLRGILDDGSRRGWKYLECRGGLELIGKIPSSVSFYGHVLDLRPGEAGIFKAFDSSLRRAIRKAETSGVKVEFSQTPESMRTFYNLHCQTRRKHGVPPQPWRFFQKIQEHVVAKGQGVVALGKSNGSVAAANVFFHLGPKAIYKFGASDMALQNLRASNLVMWEAIRWYCQRGASELHFGRTSLCNDGLRRFKLGFGTEEHSIEYFRFCFRTREFVAGREAPPGFAARVGAMLPVAWLRWLGSALYPHMS